VEPQAHLAQAHLDGHDAMPDGAVAAPARANGVDAEPLQRTSADVADTSGDGRRAGASRRAARRAVIVADLRERAGGVVSHLEALGDLSIEWAHLPTGDFLLGGGVAVERKSARDFVSSILDRRLFDQIERLLESFERPLLVLEGDPLATEIGVHPNAIRGALAHVAVARRVPVLPSGGPSETAELLAVIARQVQADGGERPRAPAKRRAASLSEHQEAVAASLPGIGRILARRLLEGSGSLAALAAADVDALRQVRGIGRHRARSLADLLTAPYQPAVGETPPRPADQ
jgi:Fanconi anemia group M protein